MDWVFWSPANDADARADARRTLAEALDDATGLARRLGRWAQAASAADLALERREEAELRATLGRAEEATATLAHGASHLDERERLIDLYEEIDAASRALEAYERARHRGERAEMHESAEAVTRSAAVAGALLDEGAGA